MKIIRASTVAIISMVIFTAAVFSQGVWEVSKESPTPIGNQVAAGEHDDDLNPDATWVASDDGLLQFISDDHDPECDQEIGYVSVEDVVYPIPTAPFYSGGDCNDTVDNLWSSIVLEVAQGDLVAGEQGGSSGDFVLNFATFTPSPTETPTHTPTSTATNVPTLTPTPTDVPTATMTPVATSTPTLTPTVIATQTTVPPPTITPTATADAPTPLIQCLEVLPERLADGSFLLWIEAINPEGYTLFDGVGYLFYAKQPIAVDKLIPGVMYHISVGTEDAGCDFQIEPTSLPPEVQPSERNFQIRLPSVLS